MEGNVIRERILKDDFPGTKNSDIGVTPSISSPWHIHAYSGSD
jgi:hypothetical protein